MARHRGRYGIPGKKQHPSRQADGKIASGSRALCPPGVRPPISVRAVKVDAQRPIFSRGVIAAIALALLVIASVTVLIQRSAPDLQVVGTIRSVGSHRLCVSAATEKPLCVEADSPRTIAGLAPGDCVRVASTSNHTLINIERLTACP